MIVDCFKRINLFTFSLFVLIFVTCKDSSKVAEPKTSTINDSISYIEKDIIMLDSLYLNKSYKIERTFFIDKKKSIPSENNLVFELYKMQKDEYVKIYSDSIFSSFGDIKFEDFNGDKIKDILFQNEWGNRGNLTYYLYLVDIDEGSVIKVKGFNKVFNPKYMPEYNLIENLVASGRDRTEFYKIEKDSVVQKGETIYWGQDANGKPKDPQKDYKRVLKSIISTE